MRRWLVALSLALTLLVFTAVALAQSGYELAWFKVAGGGGQTSGGSYTLEGSLGQAEAGGLSGGGYTLSGGFLVEGVSGEVQLYLPLISR